MEERFEVISGTMEVRVGGRERRLERGQSVVVPKGVPHTFWNPGDEELRLLVELRPALNTETMFETYFGLARDGKAFKSGIPKNPLQAAVLVRECGADTCPAWPPMPVYRMLLAVIAGVLAPVGELLGYRARYPEYSRSKPQIPYRSSRVWRSSTR